MVYTPHMRRIQLYVDDDVDQVLSAEAARRGTSRSAVIRDAVRTSLNHYFQDEPDPIDALVGWLVDADPVDDIDEVKYLVFDAVGELALTGTAEAVEDGLWQITLSAEETAGLESGANKLEVAVAPLRVSIPTFSSLEFVTTN